MRSLQFLTLGRMIDVGLIIFREDSRIPPQTAIAIQGHPRDGKWPIASGRVSTSSHPVLGKSEASSKEVGLLSRRIQVKVFYLSSYLINPSFEKRLSLLWSGT